MCCSCVLSVVSTHQYLAHEALHCLALRCRKTKVVCTIGPTSCDRESLFRLADSGMSVVRLNMSHGDHASHKVRPQVQRLHGGPLGTGICCCVPGRQFCWCWCWGWGCPSCSQLLPPHTRLAPHPCPWKRQLQLYLHPLFVTDVQPVLPVFGTVVQLVVDLVREYNALGRNNLAIMLDTKGPGEWAL